MKERFSLPLFVEFVVLLLLLGIFIFMWVESAHWPLGAALFPRVAAVLGALAIIAFAIQLVWRLRSSATVVEGRILDLQWSTGDTDARTLKKRAFVIVASIGGLWLGVWLLGFHVAIPVYLFSQLVLLGNCRWWSATLVALAGLAIIIGVYDKLLQVSWNQPAILALWRELTVK
jgi:hypothetical protein